MRTQAFPVPSLVLTALMALLAGVMPARAEIYKFVDDKGQNAELAATLALAEVTHAVVGLLALPVGENQARH